MLNMPSIVIVKFNRLYVVRIREANNIFTKKCRFIHFNNPNGINTLSPKTLGLNHMSVILQKLPKIKRLNTCMI